MTLKLNLNLDGFMTFVSRYDHFSKNAWATLYYHFVEAPVLHIINIEFDVTELLTKYREVDMGTVVKLYGADYPVLEWLETYESKEQHIKNLTNAIQVKNVLNTEHHVDTWLVPSEKFVERIAHIQGEDSLNIKMSYTMFIDAFTEYDCFSEEGWEALYKHLFTTNIAGEIIDINKEIGSFTEVDTEGLLKCYLDDFPNLKEMSRQEIKNSIRGVVFVDDGESDDFLGTWLVPAKRSTYL